jgi:hypothetical protein
VCIGSGEAFDPEDYEFTVADLDEAASRPPIHELTPRLDDSTAKVRPTDRDVAVACRGAFL